MKLRFVVLLFVVMIQCGCGTMKPIPGDTFYRLKHHDAPASEAGSTPWTQTPLIIERFRASGIYKDRAIVLLQADGVSLTQSHYH